jgi:hypothetical protein
MNVRKQFERELVARDVAFNIDPDSGCYAVAVGGAQLLVNLENLERDVALSGDADHVSRFVDSVLNSVSVANRELSALDLYWCLEPNDYEEKPEFRVAVSDRVDRVLVALSSDGSLITWVGRDTLRSLGLSESDASSLAFANLGRALSEATVQVADSNGVPLAIITTTMPFKASLILAPNLREVVGAVVGWPLMALVPDRDFLYLWPARHKDFVQRVGGVVVREYSRAPYPLSTEVYEIADGTIRAIGAFPIEA